MFHLVGVMFQGTKVRISGNNTKEKHLFLLFLLSDEAIPRVNKSNTCSSVVCIFMYMQLHLHVCAIAYT